MRRTGAPSDCNASLTPVEEGRKEGGRDGGREGGGKESLGGKSLGGTALRRVWPGWWGLLEAELPVGRVLDLLEMGLGGNPP